MPTKVLDLEFTALPAIVEDLTDYQQALVLLRFNGLPIGSLHIPVHDARLTRDQLFEAIREQQMPSFADAWFSNSVGYDWRPNPPSLPSTTVAVCTRDRPADLSRCLDSLAALPQNGQQVLVVDSCSKETTTCEVAGRYPGVRYAREGQPGLDRARNRALLEADTEIVAFIDDDAVADPGWLHALRCNFEDPEVMCVTGLTMPLELETEAQETFERVYPFTRGFARKIFHHWSLPPVRAGRVGAGANMALRKSVLSEIGPFDEALDAGTLTKSGGDTDMYARILSRGYLIVYDPAALNWHRHRRTTEELLAQAYGYGSGPYAAMAAFWIKERDPAVFSLALNWLLLDQLPRLALSFLKHPKGAETALRLAELRGCREGVRAYLTERQTLLGGGLR